MGKRSFALGALAGCIACSGGGEAGGGSGGTGGGGGVSADAAPDAEHDAADAATPVLFQQTCRLNDNELALSDRTLGELAFAQPFVRHESGDSLPCCFNGLSPAFIAEGFVALNSCAPAGGTSIAGNRVVTWYVPKHPALETFQASCSSTYYVGSQARPFAEHAFQGKSVVELSAVRAIVHQDTPAFVYEWGDVDTEYFDQRPGQIFLRDGSVAVVCNAPEDTVTFVVPSELASPATVDVPCDAGVAEHQFPEAALAELAAVRAIRHGLPPQAAAGTAEGTGDLYQIDIAEHRSTLDDDPPLVSVVCRTEYNALPIAGPVTLVSW